MFNIHQKKKKSLCFEGVVASKFMCRIKPKDEDITENKGTKR
jgi:hypothetical protein